MFIRAATGLYPNSMDQSPSWEQNNQLVKKFLVLYGTRRFITMFTRAATGFYSNSIEESPS